MEILKNNEIKEKYISITFDDALSSFLKALVEMKNYSIKPTIFLNSDPLILKKPLHNHLKLICHEFFLKNQNYDLKYLNRWYKEIMVSKKNDKKLNNGFSSFYKFIISQYLDQKKIKNCLKNKTIDIGSHTSNHKILSDKSFDEQYKLIALAHKELEKVFVEKVRKLQKFRKFFGKSRQNVCKKGTLARMKGRSMDQTGGMRGASLT